jgi:hydrogenase maturation protease
MRRVVIGVGNPVRGDDAVGTEVVRRLPSSIGAVPSSGDPSGIIAEMADAEEAIIVDAIRSGRPAGTVIVTDVRRHPIAVTKVPSTHGMGLADALELARILGTLPRRVWLVGVEVGSLSVGAALTPEAEAGIGRAVAAVCRLCGEAA